jgi:type IV fimbrial biogenesis protein FimT
VLLVLSLVFGTGVPVLQRLALDARQTADINAFVTAIQLARSESAKRRAGITLCHSSDGRSCGDAPPRFEDGWIVFLDSDGSLAPGRAGDDLLLFSYSPRTAGSIRSNRSAFRFRPNFRRSTNGTVTFCDVRGADAAKAVIVSYTGRPRVTTRGPGGRRLVCPS